MISRSKFYLSFISDPGWFNNVLKEYKLQNNCTSAGPYLYKTQRRITSRSMAVRMVTMIVVQHFKPYQNLSPSAMSSDMSSVIALWLWDNCLRRQCSSAFIGRSGDVGAGVSNGVSAGSVLGPTRFREDCASLIRTQQKIIKYDRSAKQNTFFCTKMK